MTRTGAESVAAAVGALPPIGLDELVARADLQSRVDRKYVLPSAEAATFVAGLAGIARVLEIDGRRSFGYESLYYDTGSLASYLLAARKRRRRFKVRRRRYLDSGLCYLEVKTRGLRDSTIKARMPYDAEDSNVLTEAACVFVDEALSSSGITGVAAADLVPSLLTRYRRRTLYLPESCSRVTVDTGVAWALPQGPWRELEERAIVETKAPGRACAADRRLWSAGYRPSRISKYGTGLAALTPGLPANKWHPVLRRHLQIDLTAASGGTHPAAERRPDHSAAGRHTDQPAAGRHNDRSTS